MLGGIDLSLAIGPVVTLPAPRAIMDSLVSAEVDVDSGSGLSAFTLQLQIDNRSPLHTMLVASGGVAIPLMRVILAVTVRGVQQVLMDGVMTNQQISPSGGSHSILTITGEDLSRVMTYPEIPGLPFPAMPREGRVAAILAKYMVLGVIPMIIPSVAIDVPLPMTKIPSQQGDDLRYIRAMAEEVGYVFYVEPGPMVGMSTAYWGPEIKLGAPQKPLNLDMDAHTNVESLSFSYASDSTKMPVVTIHNEMTKSPIPIPIPGVNPLSPPLGLISPIPTGLEPIAGTAKQSPLEALMVGLAKASRQSEVVTATGSLDVLRYGGVLRPRGLVGVRGAGLTFDGLYYVRKVNHKIKRGEYKQSFTLVRNGIVSTLPRIPV